jgi:hypothetical protein
MVPSSTGISRAAAHLTTATSGDMLLLLLLLLLLLKSLHVCVFVEEGGVRKV